MKTYEAAVICAVFYEKDKKCEFEDNLLIGISHSEIETKALIMEDIFRVMEDFGNDKCTIEHGRSEYDEPITIVHTSHPDEEGINHWHYYCLFNNQSSSGRRDRSYISYNRYYDEENEKPSKSKLQHSKGVATFLQGLAEEAQSVSPQSLLSYQADLIDGMVPQTVNKKKSK